MTNFAKTFRILGLKAEAKRLYLLIHHRSSQMDCGAHLASFISPAISEAEREFKRVMLELAEIDPEAKALIEKEGLCP